jgi:hypothetical protein
VLATPPRGDPEALGADLAQGLGFLKFVATKYQCPILVRGDNDDETNRVICLELGADDTIRTGTSLREVLARVRAAVRRLWQQGSGPSPQPPPSAREWRFLTGRRELIAPGGTPVPLTAAEFNLLNIPVLNTGIPLDRDYLSRAVFGRVYSAMNRSRDEQNYQQSGGAAAAQAARFGAGPAYDQDGAADLRLGGLLAGTRLLTLSGYRPIEQLRHGDLVATLLGRGPLFLPITWIGRRRVATRNGLVRVSRNAGGDAMPDRDVVLVPDHALYREARCIPQAGWSMVPRCSGTW